MIGRYAGISGGWGNSHGGRYGDRKIVRNYGTPGSGLVVETVCLQDRYLLVVVTCTDNKSMVK